MMANMDQLVGEIARETFRGPKVGHFPGHPYLALLKNTGSEIWIDSGDKSVIGPLWKREISALTTNNTLANQVVQSGVMDHEIRGAIAQLRSGSATLSREDLVFEVGFIINCKMALGLIETFNTKVSVELHPSVAHDKERTLRLARRYYRICPEKFIIKIPLTPEGFLAVRELTGEGIPVNFTLGFSARQNYLAARLARPTYVNVFLGRLNVLVSDNKIGDGKFVGEKTVMATQRMLNELKAGDADIATRLIGASIRNGEQLKNIAGVDVLTIPPAALSDFLKMDVTAQTVINQVATDYAVNVAPEYAGRVAELWEIDEPFRRFADKVLLHKPASLTGHDLVKIAEDGGVNLFHRFRESELATLRRDGKIPKLPNWGKKIALDDLMTQAALQSFTEDQAALDKRIMQMC